MAMLAKSKNIVSLVRELKPRKDTSRIEVRIIRLWKNYNKESGNTIEMVFADREGTRIHASVGEQLIKKYGERLHEGDAIVVQLFRSSSMQLVNTIFQVKFLKRILRIFTDILEGKIDSSCLVDIIGQIVNFGSLENKSIKGKDNMRLLIELRDHSNVKMMCSVPLKSGKTIYMMNVLQGFTPYLAGLIPPTLLNPTCSLVDEFKLCLPDDSLAITNKDSSQWSVASATS
ncbi:uncharacterized protein LOC130502197, partial [Raphanus sativus]|uniref:Uncharacterized protein LOC130502197 n=1 Tax=Raphanus sativus TaxID=3726 RepID=A0A9W3CN21_RAPSA